MKKETKLSFNASSQESQPLLSHSCEILKSSRRFLQGLRNFLKQRELYECRIARLEKENERLRKQLDIDPGTGLLTFKAFRRDMERYLVENGPDRSGEKNHGTITALWTIDARQFKLVNDIKGHKEGDRLLGRLASILTANVRSARIGGGFDRRARRGGDEFVVIVGGLPNLTPVVDITERFLRDSENPDRPEDAIPIDIGVVFWKDAYVLSDAAKSTVDHILEISDLLMLNAKGEAKRSKNPKGAFACAELGLTSEIRYIRIYFDLKFLRLLNG